MREITHEVVEEGLNWLPVNSQVRVRATGKKGVVMAVLPDARGGPYAIHVKLDGDVGDNYATPLVLGPHEVDRIYAYPDLRS